MYSPVRFRSLFLRWMVANILCPQISKLFAVLKAGTTMLFAEPRFRCNHKAYGTHYSADTSVAMKTMFYCSLNRHLIHIFLRKHNVADCKYLQNSVSGTACFYLLLPNFLVRYFQDTGFQKLLHHIHPEKILHPPLSLKVCHPAANYLQTVTLHQRFRYIPSKYQKDAVRHYLSTNKKQMLLRLCYQ